MVTSLHCRKCGTRLIMGTQFCPVCGFSQAEVTHGSTYIQGAASSSFGMDMLPSDHILNQRYRLREMIGRGGMGAVYMAQDIQLGDRLVALKEMSVDGLSPQDLAMVIAQFRREAHLLASLHHPRLPAIHEYFTENGRWYLAMSFIEGKTLQATLNAIPDKRLPVGEVIRIGIELCEVLEYLHTHEPPIIFRDLKPLNIMITPKGHTCLIDFGIARHFKHEQANDTSHFFSVGYAPPEQYGQSQTGPRSDIYSLGATLHQMLSGQSPAHHPFQFPPLQVVDPAIPAPLAGLIMQMVEMNELARPSQAAEIKQHLEQILKSAQSGPSWYAQRGFDSETFEVTGNSGIQKQMLMASIYTSQTSHASEMPPQSLQSAQERRAGTRYLARRSVLLGLVGGIAAIGGGSFVWSHLMNTSIPAPTPHPTPVPVSKPAPTPTIAGSGMRWTNLQRIAGQASQTPAAFAISSNGMLYMVFMENDSGNNFVCISSTDNGASWSKAYNTGQAGKLASSLCIAKDGALNLAFVANNAGNGLLYLSSKDNGVTWSNNIPVPGQNSKTAPALSCTPDGTLYIVYVANNDGNGLVYTFSKDNGATWSDNASVPQQTSKAAPAFAIAEDGVLHVAYIANNDGNGLVYTSSKDNGVTWSQVYYTGQKSSLTPALAVLNKILYLAYVANDGSNRICVISSQDGIHWSNKQEIGWSSLLTPTLAMLNKTLYLAYVADDGSNQIRVISSQVGAVGTQL